MLDGISRAMIYDLPTEHDVASPLARYWAIIYTRQYGDAEPVQICELSA